MYGSYTTTVLAYKSSSESVRAALMALPSVHNLVLGLGNITVERRGPDNHGAYTWLVAVLQDAGELVIESRFNAVDVPAFGSTGLTGLGASIIVSQLRKGPEGYGLQAYGMSDSSVAFLEGSPLTFSPFLEFVGTTAALSAVLSDMKYKPANRWSGLATMIIRVQQTLEVKAQIQGQVIQNTPVTVALLNVTVLPINQPPQFKLWDKLMVGSGGNLGSGYEYLLGEDGHIFVGGEISVDENGDTRLNDIEGIKISGNTSGTDKFLGVQIAGSDVGTGDFYPLSSRSLHTV
jgi:hypothetical protein